MTTPSPSRRLALALAVTAGLSVGACSEPSDKKAEATSGVGSSQQPDTSTTAPAATSPAATPTTATSAAAGPSTTRSPPPTRRPATTQDVTIGPGGLGVAYFGDSADATVAALTAKLGAPAQDAAPERPCNARITRVVHWGAVSAYFGPTFLGYEHSGSSDNPQHRTEAGIGLQSTVGQLKAAYGSKVRLDPGEEGTPFTVALAGGTLRGTAFGPQDGDAIYSLSAGTTCSR